MIKKSSVDEIPTPQTVLWEKLVNSYIQNNNLGESYYDQFYLSSFPKDEMPTADNVGLLLVRSLFADINGEKSSENKYVMLQSYYDQGDLSTIDIIKLPKGYHKEIIKTYLSDILVPEVSQQLIPVSNEGYSRFLTAGAHLSRSGDKIIFKNTSQDFGNKLSTYNINDVAAYLLNKSNLNFEGVSDNNKLSLGEEYVSKALNLMSEHKKSNNFYSRMLDIYLDDILASGKSISGILPHSLMMIKAHDRAFAEDKDIVQTMVEETSGGMTREFMLRGIAYKIANLKNQ